MRRPTQLFVHQPRVGPLYSSALFCSWLVGLGPVQSGALPPRRAIHGATQSVRQQRPAALAMAAAPDQPYCPLGSLTKSSAKTTDFLVRVYNPKKID